MKNKVILVTGGTGTFGQKFVELALNQHPSKIRIFSRGELLQWEMAKKFNDNRLRFFIGDVRDKNRLKRAMTGCDIVVHAAALKQIPVCEYNPIEAIETNIKGSINVIEAALDNNVDKVLCISSDKAVSPVNLYGATKMCMEKLILNANVYSANIYKTKFSCVRYGNVIGSRGSVIPLFEAQRSSGCVTITDERMTRFWLTIEQGIKFVFKAIEDMKGGEIFIPKIPSMKIADLAQAIAPGCRHEIVGIRQGEKLHEQLISKEESTRVAEEVDRYVIRDTQIRDSEFEYRSDVNTFLTVEQLKEMVCQPQQLSPQDLTLNDFLVKP